MLSPKQSSPTTCFALAVDDDVLARQPAVVHIGPARRDALVGVAVRKAWVGAGVWPDALDVNRAERLLVADRRQPAVRVEEQELIEVPQVVVAMACRPDKQVGPRRRAADHQVGIPGVVGQEVESHDLVRARSHAAVLHVMVGRTECLRADCEAAYPRNEIDAHGSLR